MAMDTTDSSCHIIKYSYKVVDVCVMAVLSLHPLLIDNSAQCAATSF